MTAVAGHTLGQTYDCKTPNCTGTARSSRGSYSYCDECRDRRGVKSTAPSRNGDGYEARAKALIAAGRKLDTARARAQVALDAVHAAQKDWESALEALNANR